MPRHILRFKPHALIAADCLGELLSLPDAKNDTSKAPETRSQGDAGPGRNGAKICAQDNVPSGEVFEKPTKVKTIPASASEYWTQVLHNHWLILLQGIFLTTLIIALVPWMKENWQEGAVKAAEADDSWWSAILQLSKTITNKGLEIRWLFLNRKKVR